MTSTDQAPEQPLITLIIRPLDPDQATVDLTHPGLTLRQAREHLAQALLEIDQQLWSQTRRGACLPASAF